MLKNEPGVSETVDYYVKPEQVPNLTPEQVDLLRIYMTLKARAREAAEQKRQAAPMVGVRM
jgi:hypothetical protein